MNGGRIASIEQCRNEPLVLLRRDGAGGSMTGHRLEGGDRHVPISPLPPARPRNGTFGSKSWVSRSLRLSLSCLPFDCYGLVIWNRADYRQDARRAGGGFVNHDLFWNVLSPWGGHPPSQDSDTIQVTHPLLCFLLLVHEVLVLCLI